MAFQWIDKIDGVDPQSANDVNALAAGIRQNETDISNVRTILESQEGSISKLSGRVGTAEGEAKYALSRANQAADAAATAQQTASNVDAKLGGVYTKSEVDDIIQSAIIDSWNEVTGPYDTLGVSE